MSGYHPHIVKAFWDGLAGAGAFLAAAWLRTQIAGGWTPDWGAVWALAGTLGAISAAVSVATGTHRQIWRYTGLSSFLGLVQNAILSLGAFVIVIFVVTRAEEVPRLLLPLTLNLIVLFLLAPRLGSRLLREPGRLALRKRRGPSPVLLFGFGGRGEAFLREMQSDPRSPYSVVGIMADPAKYPVGYVYGVGILGPAQNIDAILERLDDAGVKPVRIILSERPNEDEYRALLAAAGANGLIMSRLGGVVDDVPHGTEVRDAPVRIEDLLGRRQYLADPERLRVLISKRRVLITGAGGSIGSELVRQVLELGPARVVMVDSSEYNLFMIERTAVEIAPEVPSRAVLCDVRDAAKLRRLMRAEAPDIVLHAAALKHVPLMEDHPSDAVLTNVNGTVNAAEAAAEAGAKLFVLVSTDKAVRPTNVMGATKRLAEAFCQALAERSGMRVAIVRFGNVLRSAGSVIELFEHQIATGGPVTVTHRDVTRFFMSIPEASRLILTAASLHGDGVSGSVFVLDMGEPVRILDLAEQMIRLQGKEPGVDIAIEYTGLRPGEKMYEELSHEAEGIRTIEPGIFICRPRHRPLAALRGDLDRLFAFAAAEDAPAVREALRNLVPEFRSGNAPPADPSATPPAVLTKTARA